MAHKDPQIIIDVQGDGCGNLTLTPRNKRIAKQVGRHQKKWGGTYSDHVFLSEGGDVQAFVQSNLTKPQAVSLDLGYDVGIKVDLYTFALLVGHDFQHVVSYR